MSRQSSSVFIGILRFVLTAAGLGLLGALFGAAGALVGGKLLGADSTGFASLGLAIGGIIVGYPAGIITGIIIIRKALRQPGSLPFGILGSIIGAAAVLALAEPLNLNANTDLLFGIFLAAVPVCCLAGFYLGNRKRRS